MFIHIHFIQIGIPHEKFDYFVLTSDMAAKKYENSVTDNNIGCSHTMQSV